MPSTDLELRFRVRVPMMNPWEKVFVVGSLDVLGNWLPHKAAQLNQNQLDRDVWEGAVSFVKQNEVRFRYLIGYFLDTAKENSKKLLIVSRWESILQPRLVETELETQDGVVREGIQDIFGSYVGRMLISDGWISNEEEHVVLLRIHGEALKFYKPRYERREHRIKVVPFDVRFNEKDSVDDEGGAEDTVLPDVPSFSNTELSVLTREDPIFGSQYHNGSVFKNNTDYLVFRTRTVALEFLAFRIELYHGSTRSAIAYALPVALPDNFGKSIFPFISNSHTPVGQVHVDYMLVKPCTTLLGSIRDSTDITYGRHWRKRRTLEVGHRGMGNSYTKAAKARENTIYSLNEAANNGADYVEFDVQLTKDWTAVVYHDFHVMVEVASRCGKVWTMEDENKHHQMAVKDLKLRQLRLLHLEHVTQSSKSRESTNDEGIIRVTPEYDEKIVPVINEQGVKEGEVNKYAEPFPSLADVLEKVHSHVGFNIEVKYPMGMKDGTHECEGYFERNRFIDVILNTVYENAKGRRIVFSSFDPDICSQITQKQHRYPVLFLVVGATERYIPFEDTRSDCSKIAVNFAAGTGLLGVNFHSEELLKSDLPLRRAEKYQLVTFVWGDDLNDRKNQEFFKNQLHVDGLIYDRIGEVEKRQNVFLVEKDAKEALFSRSAQPTPQGSRRNSVDLSNWNDGEDSSARNDVAQPINQSLSPRRATIHLQANSNSNHH